jgi:hypothetical protein
MSGILVAWAKLPDDHIDWWENEFIPDRRERNAVHALHCERTVSGFEGDAAGQLDSPSPWVTIYEMTDTATATRSAYDKENLPTDEQMAGPLAAARLDIRTYRELKKWPSEEWDGGT